MSHMKVAEARARFGDILDMAEKGTPVFIERKGVTFRLTAEPASAATARGQDPFAFVDDDVLSGQWKWSAGPKGLRFQAKRKRR